MSQYDEPECDTDGLGPMSNILQWGFGRLIKRVEPENTEEVKPKVKKEVEVTQIAAKSRMSGYLDALVEVDRPATKLTDRSKTPDFSKVDKARGTTTRL